MFSSKNVLYPNVNDKVGFKMLRTPIEKNCDKSGKNKIYISVNLFEIYVSFLNLFIYSSKI